MSGSSESYARWETFVSVVGVLTAIPLILTIIAVQLPTRKVVGLFETLASAQSQLHDSIEAGLLEEDHIREFTERLDLLLIAARDVKERAHSARDLIEDFKNLIKGLTNQIRRIEFNAIELRATISRMCRQRAHVNEKKEREPKRRAFWLLVAAVAHQKLYTKVWQFLKQTPHRFLSLLFTWRSPPTQAESNCIPLRDNLGRAPSHLEGHHVHVVSSAAPAASSPLPAVSTFGDLPSPETQTVAEAQPSRRRAKGIRASPAQVPSRDRHTPLFREWKTPRYFQPRFRTLLRPVTHCRPRHLASSHDVDDGDNVLLISMAELSSIEPLQSDDDADDWEDVATQKTLATQPQVLLSHRIRVFEFVAKHA
ncbi:hypothetical protein TRAPUB_1187 [Trametes pubescens]|uniref:Uncharacterized protein n=1 Tax=Trametes pubescens TaxID=154538 RepID=A0A1M2VK10_TRAPU|nr:hypothetical protein TRAPUB_1187 [Trametes pubescens]